jgi:hypothetical protein
MNTTRVAATAPTPPVQPRSRARRVVAIVVAVVAVVTGGLGLAVAYGVGAEYGGGSSAEIAPFVVTPSVLLMTIAVFVWPNLTGRVRGTVIVATTLILVAGGYAADILGDHAKQDRLAENSRAFTCNGPNAEIRVLANVDATWGDLPRRAPIYGPIEGTSTSCSAAVEGDADQTFAEYTDAFRNLDGWQIQTDEYGRFVMTRHNVRVSVTMEGELGRSTFIEVADVS